MTDFSDAASRTAMVLAALVLTTMSVVHGQTSCTDDRDCPSDKYCYNVSSMCVDFTECARYNRLEGPTPARHSSQCGPCSPGYAAELLGTGVRESVCKRIKISKETETESVHEIVGWPWHLLVVTILAILVLLLLIAIVLKKFVCATNRDKLCRKMMPWTVRPSAPPQQDEASHRLRNKTYSADEEQPPMYSSVIQPNVDKDHLVNAAPSATPVWVNKPHYDHDFNDNVADGVAIPIRTSSTNLQMDLEEEEETNPSSWTPGQLTVELPSRPFARFGIEQQENVLNNVLLRENCSSHSSQDESSSDEAAGVREEPSGSRSSHGDIFCGPNVQINQTITLNIGKKGTK